jgi:hypothetical protein
MRYSQKTCTFYSVKDLSIPNLSHEVAQITAMRSLTACDMTLKLPLKKPRFLGMPTGEVNLS